MRRTWLIVALAVAGIVLGIAAEVVADAGLYQGAADLATGWVLLACGLWGIHQRPAQGRWPLVAAAGLTWFAGNFPATADLVYLHRGPLVHAVVAATRKRSALATAAVAVGYADALLVADANGWLTIAVVVALVALAAHDRPDGRVVGAIAALVVALVLAATTTLFTVTAAYTRTVLYAYEAGLAGAALLLVAAAARELRVHGSVTDLVVELGPARRSGSVRHALARALGDPSLTIGYWLPDGGRYIDLDGNPFVLPRPGTGRATTAVERDGQRIAALVHDESLLDDQQLVVAVREAAGLMLANDRLRAEGSARLAELRASRERIVAARDEQRRRVARRLHDGVERRLADVDVAVRAVRAGAPVEQLELLDLFDGELEQARAELRELGRGIHPRVPHRPRPRSCARVARPARAGAGGRDRARRKASGRRRGGRLLRVLRGARQRRQARARDACALRRRAQRRGSARVGRRRRRWWRRRAARLRTARAVRPRRGAGRPAADQQSARCGDDDHRGTAARSRRGMRRACIAAVAALGLAGCGGAGQHARVLHMASADPLGVEHEPAVAFFIDRVAQLSGGRLRIALDERWARGATAREAALLRDVAHGRADLGWAHASSFDRIGVDSFQALQAPLLIDRDSTQDAVIHSPLAAQMLAGTRGAGLQGLALLAGPLSRLVGVNRPLRDAGDLRGVLIAVHDSALSEDAVHALHSYSEPITATRTSLLYVDAVSEPGPPGALEDDPDTAFFDRYGGECAAQGAPAPRSGRGWRPTPRSGRAPRSWSATRSGCATWTHANARG